MKSLAEMFKMIHFILFFVRHSSIFFKQFAESDLFDEVLRKRLNNILEEQIIPSLLREYMSS